AELVARESKQVLGLERLQLLRRARQFPPLAPDRFAPTRRRHAASVTGSQVQVETTLHSSTRAAVPPSTPQRRRERRPQHLHRSPVTGSVISISSAASHGVGRRSRPRDRSLPAP